MLKLITEQLQYGIYCIAILVLKLWATTIRNLLHRHVVPNYTNSQLRAELSASHVALIISMRLSHYGQNFLHRRVMLNYSNSHYVRNCLHRNVGFILSMKLSNYGRNFLHRPVVLNLFIYLLLNYPVHYQHKSIT